jgi:DNA helicase-2/ATP-dependent DNA helicase PcrA
VGLTRAKDRLFLSRARVRRVYGAESFFRPPSRFLGELPLGTGGQDEAPPRASWDSVSRAGRTPAGAVPERAPPAREGHVPRPSGREEERPSPEPSGRFYLPEPGEADYRRGMKVRHPRYGLGTVELVEGRGPSAKVHVRFTDSGSKKFIASLAGLEIET